MRRTLLVAALLATGCASSGVDPSRGEAGELEEVKARILELQRKAAMAEVELEHLRQEVAELREASEMEARVAPDEPAGPLSRVQVSEPETAPPLPEAVEESELEPVTPAGEVEGSEAPVGPAAGVPRAVTADAQEVYDRGYTQYHQGRYAEAEASFGSFIDANPDTELTDNARFWIGESRYARGEFEAALTAFQETVTRHPQGNKVPDALLKIGDCLERLGDPEEAARRYEEVLRRFPASAASVMAEERLEELR